MEIEKDLDVVHERAAGLDISKRDAKLCVRVPGARPGTYTSKVTTWAATTGQVLELREYLEQARVDMVVMEATSDYWKPFYYLLEETVPVMLVNAKSAKNLPGHKTDVKDAAWLAGWALTGCCVPRSCLPSPSVTLGTLPGPGPSLPGTGSGKSKGWKSSSKAPGSNSPRSSRI